jgi:hypothetical protein
LGFCGPVKQVTTWVVNSAIDEIAAELILAYVFEICELILFQTRNCQGSGRNLSLYLFLKREVKLTSNYQAMSHINYIENVGQYFLV